MNGLDAQTIDELEKQGIMSPGVAASYRERMNPELPAEPTPQPQQWTSGPMPGISKPEQAAGASWGSAAQAVLGRKLQAPEVDASGYNQAPTQVDAQSARQPAALPNVPSSAGSMAHNRREYGRSMSANVEEQRAAGQQQIKGKLEAERVGAQRAAEESGYAKERISQMEADQAAAVERRRQFNERMQAKQAQLDQEMATAREEKIDTDRRGIGQKIGGAIAIALGAYAQALGGGENVALKLVQQQIENDIQAQREGMAARRQLLGEKRQALAQERGQFADDEDFSDRQAAKGYEIAKSKIEALLGEKYIEPETQARLTQMRGEFEAKQAEHLGAIMERTAVNTNAMLANEDAARARAFGSQIDMLKSQGGPGLKPVSEGAADKIAELRATRRELQEIRDSFVEKTGAGAFVTKHIPGSDAQKIDRKISNAMIRWRRAMTGVNFSPAEAAQYAKLFPTASTIDETAINDLDAILESTKNQERTFLETQRQIGHDTRGLEQGGPDSASGFTPEG